MKFEIESSLKNKMFDIKFILCKAVNCNSNKHQARGYCNRHYRRLIKRLRKLGLVELPKKKTKCKVEDCNNKYNSKGYCAKHYARLWHNGTLIIKNLREKREILIKENKNICCQCKCIKNITSFCKNKNSKYGINLTCKKCAMENHYKVKYNINSKQYHLMRKQQNYKCLICSKSEEELNKKLCIDHSHLTKTLRGLLCQQCNLGIGFLKENINILQNAINYLESSKNEQPEEFIKLAKITNKSTGGIK